MASQPTAPIRTVWTYKVNGEQMGTYTEDYARGMYNTLANLSPSSRVQLVRFDHYASDFATTGKNWTSIPTVVEDTHPEAAAEPKQETTAIELLDPMRTCRRCKGTGTFWIMSDNPAPCRNCSAAGKVPSARDRRRIAAAERNYYRLVKAMRARAEERDGRRNGRIEFESHQGFGLLEQNEPHRLPDLFRSLEAGRVDDVIDTLIAYRNAHVSG
jgi:rubrerythrin